MKKIHIYLLKIHSLFFSTIWEKLFFRIDKYFSCCHKKKEWLLVNDTEQLNGEKFNLFHVVNFAKIFSAYQIS